MAMREALEMTADPLLEKLDDVEVQRALVALLDRLPELVAMIDGVERAAHYVRAAASDEGNLERFAEAIREPVDMVSQKIRPMLDGQDMLEAATVFPAWLRLMTEMAHSADAISAGLKTLRQLEQAGLLRALQALGDAIRPGVLDDLVQVVGRSIREADQDTTVISVFGILRMLKEPAVQRLLRVVSTMLRNLAENQKR
ncbi:DUF1641 domain-containing protein [Kyrpidia spormannii]|uniref:Uncharacterized protein n=1 Tax=Kyrpidia spormannii TaxID=2055160 RepID=A0ACA8Z923_9BACL|nr:DUF1641 domain-containing protein [Kyrpidia spormannii]CAB3391556.1 conserved protein of unknown function [Kyrpidia spormannii]